jgi:hypothetical protein
VPGLIPAQLVKRDPQSIGEPDERGDPSVPTLFQILDCPDRNPGDPGQSRNGKIFGYTDFLELHNDLLKQVMEQYRQQKKREHGEQDTDCEA